MNLSLLTYVLIHIRVSYLLAPKHLLSPHLGPRFHLLCQKKKLLLPSNFLEVCLSVCQSLVLILLVVVVRHITYI